jgi:hypothetical protein
LAGFAICPRLLPEPERDWKRIDVELLPPCGLIARAMKLAVMDPANRNSKLVAHSVSKPTRLGKREVMRIGWDAAAHKAGLPEHEPAVLLIAQSNRFAQSTHCAAAIPFLDLARACLRPAGGYRTLVRGSVGCAAGAEMIRNLVGDPTIADRREPRLKPLFDNLGIRCCQSVLGRQTPTRPGSRLVRRIYGRQLLNQAFAKTCR